jgi:hypothetical protein
MIMHHNAICTPCITLVNCGHLLHIRVDHVEPKAEIKRSKSDGRLEVHKCQAVKKLILL